MTNPRKTTRLETSLSKSNITVSGTKAVFRTTDRTNGHKRNGHGSTVDGSPVNGLPINGTSAEGSVTRPAPVRGTLHDPITGLANENFLLASLRAASQRAIDADSDSRPALIVLQIERILHVATCFGPQAQKSMLETVARRLESLTPPDGTLARTGAHEFTFLMQASNSAHAGLLATKVERALRKPLSIDGHLVLPVARIGIADSASDSQETVGLLSDARLAAGGPTGPDYASATHFDPALREEAAGRMRLEAELSLAVDRHELRLHYQPMISIESGEVSGFEALLRWEHPQRGTILPAIIIPLAEKTGLIDPIGDWVLSEACTQMAVWQDTYPGARSLTLNVNLSARQLEQADLVRRVLDVQKSSGIEVGTLRLELTESVVIANQTAVERLRELQQHGIEIQLDDFGSGYSSLSYLGRLPIDSLKLDRTFVEQYETDSRSATILNAVVALARELGIGVTAEGIETKEQAERIRSLSCETGQGYFFHRPLDGEAVEQLLVA